MHPAGESVIQRVAVVMRIAIVSVVVLIGAACGAASPAGAASATSSSPRRSVTTGTQVDVCSLLTVIDAEDLMGEAALPPRKETQSATLSGQPTTVAACYYDAKNTPGNQVGVFQYVGNDAQRLFASSPYSQGGQPIPGLGDEAVYTPVTNGTLLVRSGRVVIQIGVATKYGGGTRLSADQVQAKLVSLMRKALAATGS